MNLDQYVKLAVRTESVPESLNLNRDTLAVALDIFVTAGKLLDGVKRSIYYKNDERLNANIRAQLGTIAHLTEYLSVEVEDVLIFEEDKPALAFKSDQNMSNVNPRLLHGVIGIATEAAELCEALIPSITDPANTIDVVNLDEELGDINWYEAIITDEAKLSWTGRQERNIEKLRVRYPEKYSDLDAIDRDLDAERAVLETVSGRGISNKLVYMDGFGEYRELILTEDGGININDVNSPYSLSYSLSPKPPICDFDDGN